MADRRLVQCRSAFAVTMADGGRVVVSSGDIYWADDDMVKGREGCFTDVDVKSTNTGARVSSKASATGSSVETASAGPGSRRRLSKAPEAAPQEAPEESKSEV